MRSLAFATLLTFHAAGLAVAAESIDELYARRVELKKKIDELKKELDTADAAIKSQFSDLQSKLAKDGIIDPGPVPPAPPPKPVDVLKESLKTAYAKDGCPRDAAHQLAELYRLAAGLAKSPKIGSTLALRNQVNEAAVDLMKDYRPGVVQTIREVVAEAWVAAVGKANGDPITEDERKKAGELFEKLADILGGF